MQETSTSNSSRLYRFLSNPIVVIVGLVGAIASIISIPLAIYLYLNSTIYRELAYLVNPAKATVVKLGQSSRLSVMLDGKPISTDATAVQLAIWNAGNAPIKPEHVLQPFKVVIPAQIIDATVRKTSRNVVHLDLDKGRMEQGELGVSWNILEHGDGAILQIVYAGDPSTPISVNAVIEGQRAVREVEADFTASGQRYATWSNAPLPLAILIVGVGGFFAYAGISALWVETQLSLVRRTALSLLVSAIALGFIIVGVIMIFNRQPDLPFSF